jgi:hypothetical protein
MLMRCTFAFVLCLLATGMQAQDSLLHQQLTIPRINCNTEEALKIIERQTGLSFSYNTGLINKRRELILAANQEPLIDILSRIFDDPAIEISIVGRHIALYRTYKTPSADPENSDSVHFFIISGKVLDKETREPLPFSSVYLVGKTIGTISNEEGEFKLKLNSGNLSEILSISCMGYKNFSASVASLINTNKSYFLETDLISIQEVIIRKMSPVMLLQESNNRIRKNYSDHAAILTSFYRETVQRGGRFTMVSEAILENFKSGYRSQAPDRVKILKGRKNEDFSRNDSLILKLKAGLNTMLMLDVVKNIPDFLTGESLQDYHYRLTDLITEDNRDNYVIEFIPKENSPEGSFYSGRIIIDIQDMAFRWVEFQVDPANLDLATERFIVRKPPNVIVKALKANYKVAYRKHGDNYYLHMIVCETGFRIRNRGKFSGTVYNTKLETVVTEIDTVNVSRFPLRESARPYEFFTEQIGSYDEVFWGEYNFITPDESLENALQRLLKKEQITNE